MKIGIFGLPMSGKSTIFSLLTETPFDSSYKTESDEKIAYVKDKRIDILNDMYKPEKKIYAKLNIVDIPSYDIESDVKEKTRIFQMIQNVDAFVLVLRAFKSDNVPFPSYAENPLKQLQKIETEFIFRDIEVLEKRIERLEEQKKKKKLIREEEKEIEILNVIKEHLENEKFISKMNLSNEQKKLISSLSFYTLKPIIVLINLDEEQFSKENYEDKEEIINKCKDNNFAYLELSGKIESDLIELDKEERDIFMEDLKIDEPGINKLSRSVYECIGLISFFTTGKDEVRAWTIKKGTNMKKAAGAIHSDLEKNFIKAEVIKYNDLIELKTEDAVKNAGLWKLAGKEEEVNDGDILQIRANC